MKDLLKRCAVIVGVFSVMASAAPEVSFGGYLDADVWSDLTGMYYANQELDLGMSLKFTDKVSANVYATALGGMVPAGLTEAESRWVSFDFDGFDITFDTDIGFTTSTIADSLSREFPFTCLLYIFTPSTTTILLSLITLKTFPDFPLSFPYKTFTKSSFLILILLQVLKKLSYQNLFPSTPWQ